MSRKRTNLPDPIDLMLSALFGNNTQKATHVKNEITEKINKLMSSAQINIFDYTENNELKQRLIEHDKKLSELRENFKTMFPRLENNFDDLLSNLGLLQGLISLQKINKCDNGQQVIKSLIDALNDKLSAVNDIIIENLNNPPTSSNQTGGSYKGKYLKYKLKSEIVDTEIKILSYKNKIQ